MRRRLLPLLLCLAMVLAVLPGRAMAATTLQGDSDGNGTVDVTLTVSQGTDDFYKTKQNKRLFKETLSVPYFDLELYDLDQYYYNPDCYTGQSQTAGTQATAQGVVTTMHVFIWATERFVLGLDAKDCGKGNGKDSIAEHISWAYGAGSTFMTFWNGSTNLNYYLDYRYPLGKPGYGSTSDQQALSDGVAIDVHLIVASTLEVHGSQFSFFQTAEGTRDFAQVTQGNSLDLTLYKTVSSYGSDTTGSATVGGKEVCYISADNYTGQKVTQWQSLGTTDSQGKITIPNTLTAGTYYLSCPGEVVGDNELAPAAFRLTVEDAAVVTLGDANGDGKVDAFDASLILRYAAGQVDGNTVNTAAVDVDGSGKVDAYDASLVLRYVAGLITEFPKKG